MKIKRYEAATMTEALRKIKKDFGEDAVILSAKTSKRSAGVFSTKSDSRVVVTAAIDMAPPKKTCETKGEERAADGGKANSWYRDRIDRLPDKNVISKDEFQEEAAQRLTENGRDARSFIKTRIANQPSKLFQLKPDYPSAGDCGPPLSDLLYKNFRQKGLSPAISHEITNQINQLSNISTIDHPIVNETLARVIDAKGWVATPVIESGAKSRPIVLVGVHGAGKTTTAAKLAAEALLQSSGKVGVLSLDYQRIAAHVELERAAYVMGVKLLTASNMQQLDDLIPQIHQAQHMIIDTTGIAIGDESAREELSALLAHIGEVEIHLVLNACLQENIADKIIKFYRPLGVEKLLFTQIDNVENTGHLFNLIENNEIPVSYMGFGAQVPGDLHIMNAEKAAEMLLPTIMENGNGSNSRIESTMDDHEQASMPNEAFVSRRKVNISKSYEENSAEEVNSEFELMFKDYPKAKGSAFKS